MNKAAAFVAAALLLAAASPPTVAQMPNNNVPDEFPRFTVPGREAETAALRGMHWLHYQNTGPVATLWDEWLAAPSLWPGVTAGGRDVENRRRWRAALEARDIDAEGYVATHQHASLAHPQGWPFPFWNQGVGGAGWHFSFENTVGPPWRGETLSTPEPWTLRNAESRGVEPSGWRVALTQADAALTAPAQPIDTLQSPFLQIRWKAEGVGDARPFVEWTTANAPRFAPDRRVYFDPPRGGPMTHAAVAMYKHPAWKGTITGLRVGVGNASAGGSVVLQALFTQYDTRHNINNQSFIKGCVDYVAWTGDLAFLRANINRMRLALRYLQTEHHALAENIVRTTWVGHDGRTGLKRGQDGAKTLLSGHGVGNNYWDLLPFGNEDCYATLRYYAAVREMAAVERAVAEHPEWDVPGGPLRLDPEALEKHAAAVKREGNKRFWNAATGRFVACIDADGQAHDYGLTFVNLEAVHYGFATDEHARSVLDWLTGKRLVAGDTSRGADIYHWRFAPRATTRRNVDWYGWFWTSPESIPWGGQVQDGGAVLGFSYHDLMARLRVLGPDDAAKRLAEIARWYGEVEAAGGYRRYYDGTRPGTLQGGGPPGGLGMDQEFFESVLVPQALLDGFLGLAPTFDGFRIAPKLPRDWPEVRVDRVRWRDHLLTVRATRDAIEIDGLSPVTEPIFVVPPSAAWGLAAPGDAAKRRARDGAFVLDVAFTGTLRLVRTR